LKVTRNKLLSDIQENLSYLSQLGVEYIFNDPSPQRSMPESVFDRFKRLEARIHNCRKCPLGATRTHAVPGEGNKQADLMFIGEGPGRDEDLQGRPFVGKAGELLTRIIHAMGFRREDVYIANIIKCRPPDNRNPNRDEIENCSNYLYEQLELVKPRVIVTLGNVPTQFFLQVKTGITSLRGNFYPYGNIQIMPTFHPSYLIRNENDRQRKRLVWEDMKKVCAYLGMR
jgi:DNA polymerase